MLLFCENEIDIALTKNNAITFRAFNCRWTGYNSCINYFMINALSIYIQATPCGGALLY